MTYNISLETEELSFSVKCKKLKIFIENSNTTQYKYRLYLLITK